ncbi:MAG: hypothetical protein E7249_02035 [Paenibacillaceae bacterium]|nr:hypothetical protein [Paenibacillaceae bacterium]
MDKELINTENIDEISIKRIIDGLTGFISGSKADYAHSANRLLKSLFAHDFLFQLQKEWDKYVDRGNIDLDYKKSKPFLNSLSELMDYLDTDLPNDEIALTLKKLFFIPAFKDYYKEDKLLAIEYMKIIRKLTPGEMVVLFTAYNNVGISTDSASKWLEIIAEKSTLKYTELVELHEKKLIDLNLITKRKYEDNSGLWVGKYSRLTSLGYNLCHFIKLYDEFNER